jgi:hypothetical protein
MKRTVVALNLARLGLLSLLVLATTVARAAEVRVMISGGLTAAYKELGQRFDGLNHIRLLRRVYMTKSG